MATSRTSLRAAATLLGGLLALALASCGGSERTALAIEDVRWKGPGALVVTTECASDVEYETGPDHSGVGLLEVTVWGEPTVGTCRPDVVVPVPDGTTQVVDGTTSMVVDLPAPARTG